MVTIDRSSLVGYSAESMYALVEDIVMPPIGMLLGKVDFKSLYVALDGKTYENFAAAKKAAAPLLAYGHFLNIVIEFLIIAWCIFIVVRQINRMQPKT